MREIKFRALFFSDNEWVDMNLGDVAKLGDAFINYKHWRSFTGLEDKNGVEIYEGDIVKKPADLWIGTESIGEAKGTFVSDAFVEFVKGSFRLNKLGDERDNYYGPLEYTANTKSSVIEVIGNIYENKEVLSEDQTK